VEINDCISPNSSPTKPLRYKKFVPTKIYNRDAEYAPNNYGSSLNSSSQVGMAPGWICH
jgi:hypothetical protein